MATFETRVENYIGTTSTDLGDVLTQGAANLVDIIPEGRLMRYASSNTDSGSGVSIEGKRFAGATKSNRLAVRKGAGLEAALKDSDSIHEATSFSPAFIEKAGKVYVFPSGGTVYTVGYPTVAQSDSSISNFPDVLEPAVVVYAAMQETYNQIQDIVSTIDTDLGSISYTDFDADHTDSDTRLDDDDIEISQGRIQKAGSLLDKIRTQINETSPEFTKIEQKLKTIQGLEREYNRIVETYLGGKS